MREDTVTRVTSGTAERSAEPAAAKPGPGGPGIPGGAGVGPAPQVHDGAVPDLACSLDGLYGCIELISEGRPAPVTRIMRELEKSIITQAMVMSRANMRGAALLLGIKYTTLYAKIKKHNLSFSKAMRFAARPAGPDLGFLGR